MKNMIEDISFNSTIEIAQSCNSAIEILAQLDFRVAGPDLAESDQQPSL